MIRRTGMLILVIATVFASPGAIGAQPPRPDDTVDVTADLTSPSCSVDLASSGGFGTWTWDGTAWIPEGETEVVIVATFAKPTFGGCWFTYRFGGLDGPDGTIDTSHFGLVYGIDGFPQYQYQAASASTLREWWVWSTYENNYPVSFWLELESIPELGPGVYTGVVELQVSNAV